ncbi:hypothetical protein BDN72DRAFT_865503 [Pluteus cervinus]|uniref:Uncharacterized protein n=1 Tax=Pluteus cervinus TaxID=181527 RepID=A0ACD3A049_9AGAR|nr:hypothetical protein BDN72DRAFT_865503 [Pluteus cervinus]
MSVPLTHAVKPPGTSELMEIALGEFFQHGISPDFVPRVGTTLGVERRVGTGVSVSKDRESLLKERFPPRYKDPRKVLARPAVVVDRRGRILVWYLPGILCQERNEAIYGAVHILQPELKTSIKAGGPWRTDARYFRDGDHAGCINLSPAWFQQARDPFTADLEVSSLLKAPGNGRKWVEKMQDTFALVNAISNVLHPDQHDIGKQAMEKLRKEPNRVKEGNRAKDVLTGWTSVFSAIAIVLNRETPTHRDMQSPATGLDVMLTVGPYSEAWMVLETLGVDLLYRSGTMVALSGSLIPHGVECSEVGRLCLSFYMRYAVHENLGLNLMEYTVHGGHHS